MQNLEYIDRFFKDELSPEEVRQFEQRIESDPEFAEEVAFYVSAMNVAKEQAATEKRDRFRQIPLNNHHNKPLKKTASIRSIWAYAAAAAVAILVIGLYMFYPSDQPAQIAERYIQTNLVTLSVNMSAERDSIQTGLAYFNDGELEKASEIFGSLIAANAASVDAIKYAGITALRMDNYELALKHFMRLEQMQLYANPGKFYHALTLMKRNNEGDQQQAKILLQDVVNQDLEGKEHAEKWLKDL